MNEMPERIWAQPEHPDENGYGGFWIKARATPAVEYIRADVAPDFVMVRRADLLKWAEGFEDTMKDNGIIYPEDVRMIADMRAAAEGKPSPASGADLGTSV